MKHYWGITIIEWVILVTIIGTIVLYAWAQTHAPDLQAYIRKYDDSMNWTSVEDLFENANNGDLVFMSGNTKGEKTCRWCTGSMYSHVGMLFRENHPETGEDILYVWDSDLGQRTKAGPRILEFKNKLARYHGYPNLMWRQLKGDRPSTDAILEVSRDYSDKTFDDKILSWWASEGVLSPLYRLVKDEDKIFCSELIALTLQHDAINILDQSKVAAWYSPGSFAGDSITGLNPGYSYGPRQFVKFHPRRGESEDLEDSSE